MVKTDYEVVVVGGGPAGLAAGQYSARAGRKTAIVEELSCGGQAMIIDEIENYPGMGKTTGYELAAAFENQAVEFGCEIVYDQIQSIEKTEDGIFNLNLLSGKITARAVIIATGSKHRNLDVPGERDYTGHGVSYCATCDGPFFKEKKILVCGGGDSAVQEAMYLTKLSSTITVCHRRDRFRAQAAVVDNLMKTGRVSLKMNHNVLSINGKDGKVSSVTFRDNASGKEYTEDFDAVFVFVGNIPQSALVGCEKDESGFILTDFNMQTSVPGMFAAGDVRKTPFRQVVTAASDGAIAAHYASEYIDAADGRAY